MLTYCVNGLPQENGRHEVHEVGLGEWRGCLPAPDNRVPLGQHESLAAALAKAGRLYLKVTPCRVCGQETLADELGWHPRNP